MYLATQRTPLPHISDSEPSELNIRIRASAARLGSIRIRPSEPTPTGAAVVEVDPERHHLLEHPDRRPDMDDPRLDRPGTIARRLDPIPDRDGQVLVPGDAPVRPVGLVEQEPPHRERPRAEDR